ncbi:Ribosome bioproteinsis protein ERB1 [Sphaceloma murrayae]|uniref:Ribosome bioproteinsis protein ERB1 n=1 Tax=Sphaceloma murrayae TaxID=2082308 RepID=A0A2K1QZM1_9PEZI|nr:Ribosome bioproteinsis protein ERB1 [Sphaceloma murrayae]
MAPTPWTRGILLGTWIPRTIVCIAILGLAISAQIAWQDEADYFSDEYSAGTYSSINSGFIVILVFVCVTIASDILEAVLYFMKRLHPVLYLCLNLVKLVVWSFYLVSSIIAIVVVQSSASGIIIAILLFLFTLWSFVYACKMVHHRRMEKKSTSLPVHENRTEMSRYG